MALVERQESPEPVRGVERALEIQLGRLGGVELRPTRVFLWSGDERDGQERIVALGREPRSLDIPHREHELRAGAVRVRTLGNPLMTVALAGVHAARSLAAQSGRRPTEP